MSQQLVCSLLLVVAVVVAGHADWSYSGNDNGPEHWKDMYPECGGERQSPVNVDTEDVVGEEPWPEFQWHHFKTVPKMMTLTNTGHSAQVSSEDLRASVTGGDLGAEYTFDQFHFHWGSDDKLGGCEHTVDDKRWASELHLVFYKTEYGSMEAALKKSDGVAVFAVFLEHSQEDNPSLHNVVAGLSSITNPEDSTTIKPFPLMEILPRSLTEFYRYQGSLTTPGCNQVVTWTVFKRHITVSSAQLKMFRSLKFEDGEAMQDNFRPIQPLNDREIFQGLEEEDIIKH
ncbi:carbonic anhydrase 2-like [Homarus americanus]|uniref:carbonic anhydrase n=1 Tax=Homarus americanus TaxID=6706 RepID=A0A8J5MLL8_HOMAM|nr:carbonic anhydrase 2-like [Homarus americanus]XP_042205215.1 carbonic anhydrase 2-like [Homarus americanus]KAG7155750.1 Carbonic anhydrase 14-like 2 [Homarus americanus]